MNTHISREFNEVEVIIVIQEMNLTKARRLDDMAAIFYKKIEIL